MSQIFSPSERRLARILLLATVAGTLWHTVDGLLPPPPPVRISSGMLIPDSTGAPVLYESGRGSVYSGEVPGLEEPLDLLIADEEALQNLPGIGPVLARRIVKWRELRSEPWKLEDILEVPGIGPFTLERFREHVRIGSPPADSGRSGVDTVNREGEGNGVDASRGSNYDTARF